MAIFDFGNKKSSHKFFGIGPQEATIEQKNEDWTFREFANQIAKQMNIKNGRVDLISVNFIFTKYDD